MCKGPITRTRKRKKYATHTHANYTAADIIWFHLVVMAIHQRAVCSMLGVIMNMVS